MILQTLSEYHKEQVAIGNPNYAPKGTELKRIHFILTLTGDGMLIDVEQPKQKICVAKSRARGGKDAPLIANRMWDNIGYVLGYGIDEKQKKTARIQHRSFVELVKTIHHEHPENRSFSAVHRFYSHHITQIYDHHLWSEITSKQGYNLSFRLVGESLLAAQQEEILTYGNATKLGNCVISGIKTATAHTHPKLYVPGCSPTGAKLVSFTKHSGYDSYGKQGGENASTSIDVTESYSAALTGLLQPESQNCVSVSNVTFIFYTLPENGLSTLLFRLLGTSTEDNRQQALDTLKDKVWLKSKTPFALIALVPNAARVSVRLHIRSTVAEVAANILKFYEDTTLENSYNLRDAMSILTPLFATSPQDNIKKQPPQLIIDYIESVICGCRLSVLFQQESLSRLREHTPRTLAVCSMLKCYLTRNTKTYMPMSLDTTNKNIGYILGRLFAILERAQELSSPGLSFTIRDTYYNTISVTPSAIFNRLVSLSSSYFRRITSRSTSLFMKIQFSQVVEMLDGNSVPMRLSLDEQSHFALGYFHQRQTYFKKRESDEQSN